jgi:hypothetical protein
MLILPFVVVHGAAFDPLHGVPIFFDQSAEKGNR